VCVNTALGNKVERASASRGKQQMAQLRLPS
jgi:hypothetical protein